MGDAANIRTFVAVDFDAAGRHTVERAQRTLAARDGCPAGVRFVAEGSLHLTLKFLGQTAETAVPAIAAQLLEVARTTPRLVAKEACFDAFSRPSRAHVVVLELFDDGALAHLARRVDDALAPLGFTREERPFRPHVTLARAKKPADVREWLGRAEPTKVTAAFEGLTLFRSDGSNEGPKYTALSRASFAGTSSSSSS